MTWRAAGLPLDYLFRTAKGRIRGQFRQRLVISRVTPSAPSARPLRPRNPRIDRLVDYAAGFGIGAQKPDAP